MLKDFMNEPIDAEVTHADIVNEYKRLNGNIPQVAKIYCMTVPEIKKVLAEQNII